MPRKRSADSAKPAARQKLPGDADTPKRGRGRPGTPDVEVARLMQVVCERVSRGELVKYAAREEGTTDWSIRQWALRPEYATLYARARDSQAHALAEQAIEIADGEDGLTALYEEALEAEEDRIAHMGDGPVKGRALSALASLRSNVVNRDRMRMDARKWLASKISPKIYGDKVDVTSDNKPLAPSQTIIIGDRRVEF